MGKALDDLQKIHSRLRCVANGDTRVNAVRAQQNGAVRVTRPQRETVPDITAMTVEQSVKQVGSVIRGVKRRAKQKKLPPDVEVNVFVLLNREDAKTPPQVKRRHGRIGSATIPLSQLPKLDKNSAVQLIELAETLRAPDPWVNAASSVPGASRHAALNARTIGKTKKKVGRNVLVGIIDVGGLDFAHEDFLDDKGRSRVVGIWDQGGDAFAPPRLPDGKSYGSEITAADIAFALAPGNKAFSPHDLAPQSQRSRGSHATHVASIAAGRSGLCKRAKIAAVMIAVPDKDMAREKSFYDTTAIADALTYLFEVARKDPAIEAISVNISLGTNGGAHDGSELLSRWIDMALTEPGRAVCAAAGNSGQEAPAFEGDYGFWSGRVHTSGQIPAAALRRDLEWVVVGDGIEDVSENELEIWYSAQDEFTVELFHPAGHSIGTVRPGERIENLLLPDRTVVSMYNVLCDPKNGDNRISIFLSPYMGEPIVGITPGSWKVRLTGSVIRNGSYHGWIERDDAGRARGNAQWRLPSFFGPGTFVDNSTLSSLACGPRVIGVANLDEARDLLHITSSQGPTRDGRTKPEIAAPGTAIVAACGFDPQNKWIEMTGTSMASPYVAGVAALMLSLNPNLTAAQIAGIMLRTSKPLPGSSYAWQNGAGFGVIDAAACLERVDEMLKPVKDLTDDLEKDIKARKP